MRECEETNINVKVVEKYDQQNYLLFLEKKELEKI